MFGLGGKYNHLTIRLRNGLCRWCKKHSKTSNGRDIYDNDAEYCSVECQEAMANYLREKERKLIKRHKERIYQLSRGDDVETSYQAKPKTSNLQE